MIFVIFRLLGFESDKEIVDAVSQKYKQESVDDEYFNKQEENDARFNSYMPYCDDYIKTIIQALVIIDCGQKRIELL